MKTTINLCLTKYISLIFFFLENTAATIFRNRQQVNKKGLAISTFIWEHVVCCSWKREINRYKLGPIISYEHKARYLGRNAILFCMFSIGINRDVGVIENNILLLCHKLLLFIHVTKNTHLGEQKLNLYSIMCHHKKHDITHFVCCFYGICKNGVIR